MTSTSLAFTMATTKIPSVNPNPSTPEFAYANDIFYTFIIPPICVFGIATNILNIIVFSHQDLVENTYKYLKMNAYSNLIYLFICAFIFTVRCGQLCVLDDYYITQLYYWIIYTYIKGSLII